MAEDVSRCGVPRRGCGGGHLRVALRHPRPGGLRVRGRDLPRTRAVAPRVPVQAPLVRAAHPERQVRDQHEDPASPSRSTTRSTGSPVVRAHGAHRGPRVHALPAEGAVGSLDYTKEERRKLAERSRREPPEFGAASLPERREVARRAHAAALRKWADRRNQSGETENLDANPVSVTRENVPATCVPASRDASDTEADTEADGNGNERASATDASSNGFGKRTTTAPRDADAFGGQ